MINLLLTTFFTVSLFLFFSFSTRFGINSFHAIVSNYFICILLSLCFLQDAYVLKTIDLSSTWIVLSLLTGALFPLSFYLMALAIEKVNVSVASVANKMSLVIPVTFNLLFLQTGGRDMSALNITGICIALPAIILASTKKADNILMNESASRNFMLPIIVFLTAGIIDTMINYISFTYLGPKEQSLFPLFTFIAAAGVGSFFIAIRVYLRKERIALKSVYGGIILGVPNFFSIYFMLKTFDDFNKDGAFVFPFLNIAVIILSSLAGVLLFKEKLSKINLAGIILAFISICLIFLNWELFLKEMESYY
jgi:drug/metabolite transporter (DMT)-like permease